jgi:hypothetical protein
MNQAKRERERQPAVKSTRRYKSAQAVGAGRFSGRLDGFALSGQAHKRIWHAKFAIYLDWPAEQNDCRRGSSCASDAGSVHQLERYLSSKEENLRAMKKSTDKSPQNGTIHVPAYVGISA